MIVNRHTGGSVVNKWDKIKQDRFLHKRYQSGESIDSMTEKFPMSKSEIRSSLKRYVVYREIENLELEESVQNVISNEKKFSITNLERLYEHEGIQDFLGIDFDESDYKLIKKLPKSEFQNRFGQIVEDVATNKINSRVANSNEDKSNYLKKLIESGSFDLGITPDLKYNEEYDDDDEREENDGESNPKKPKRNRKSTTKLIPPQLYLVSGVNRIDDILRQLKSLHLIKQSDAVAVLFRSYLDMISYQFLKRRGGLESLKMADIAKQEKEAKKKFEKVKSDLQKLGINHGAVEDSKLRKALGIRVIYDSKKIPSLKFMLSHMVKEETLIPDGKLRQALASYLATQTKLLGHNEYNLLVHNEYYTASPEELRLVWNQMQPLLEYLIDEIKK